MVVPLPHKTLADYHRDFEAGILEGLCFRFCPTCPTCGALIDFIEYRLRKAQGLWVLRGRRRGPRPHHFTYLPQFVAPGKWYPYPVIEEALCFVAQERYGDRPTAALTVWEENREKRIEEGLPPGPSSKTVGRWASELGHCQPSRPWAERAHQAILDIPGQGWPGPLTRCGPDGLPGEKTPPTLPTALLLPPHPSLLEPRRGTALFTVLLGLLRLLGETLLGRDASASRASALGMGLWCLEGRFRQRCLARDGLVGNIVPWLIPDMGGLPPPGRGYPPKPPPPS